MRFKRVKAFIIDFVIIVIAFNIINSIFPPSSYVRELKAHQNEILEEYTSHNINFKKYLKEYGLVVYEIDSEQKVVNISYMIFMILYFIVLPFIWKGRTIGSYINGIQIERFDKGYLFIHQLLIRNIIVVGLGYLILKNIFIYFIPSKYYFIVISCIGLIQIVMSIFSFNMLIFSKEKRGLQDLISNTEMTKIIK